VEAGQTLDHQSRPGVCPKKKRRDRLIRLAATHSEWVLGFGDEVWWSRLAQPAMHTWTPGERSLRLVEKALTHEDPDPKALACYGVLLRATPTMPEQLWLRFATGQPVSALTLQFLTWCCQRLAALGKRALLLVWDNASWHKSQLVRTWLRAHNHHVKRTGRGVRIVPCLLPSKSPWLNPIEPKWVHGKRAIVEPVRVLTAHEVAERVCAYYGCPHEAHLFISEKAA
jgi:DDE superfamily endonuclease